MSGFFIAHTIKTNPQKIYLLIMGINRSQAEMLATTFLDDLEGEEKSVLQPKETFSELFVIAGELADDSQKNLNESNSNASGGLSKSLVLDEPVESGGVVSVNLMMNDYGNFINKGVKGTKSGSSTAGYSYKTENPSPKMLANLQRGKIKSKRKIRNTNANKTVSKSELKNIATSKAAVWGAAVNIKRYGIKPTGFLDKAIATAEKKIEGRLGAALKIDILNSI